MRRILLLVIFPFSFLSFSQKKALTLEDIWVKGIFSVETINGLSSMNDGQHYSSLESSYKDETAIVKYQYKTGKAEGIIVKQSELILPGSSTPISIDNYTFSQDENKILISTQTEKIYRHSTREDYFVYDLKNRKLEKVSEGEKLMYGSLSPDGNKVAFVRSNNLFVKDMITKKEIAITNDGKFNNIINGATDWVYEEESAFEQAYQWNIDGSKIAYYKFDESRVKEFEMNEFNGNLYPIVNRFKYPKAGEENSTVTIHVYDLKQDKSIPVDIGKETNQYIPRILWTNWSLCLPTLQPENQKLF